MRGEANSIGWMSGVIALIIGGCSVEVQNQDDEAQSQAGGSQSFRTADALIDEFNRLTTSHPIDYDVLFDLFAAENEFQERMLALQREMIPVWRLDQAMQTQFGEMLDPRGVLSQRPNHPASITQRTDRRAQAEYVDWDGSKMTLHLVELGDGWHISGYTFEHHPEIDRNALDVDAEIQIARSMAAAARAVNERLQRGGLNSAEEVRAAFFPPGFRE